MSSKKKINKITKCKDKICNIEKIEKMYEDHKKFLKDYYKKYEEKFEEKKGKLSKYEKNSMTSFAKTIKMFENKNYKKEEIKKMKKFCENIYCNEKNCKGTLLEKGPPNKISNNLVKNFKNDKNVINGFLRARKYIFKEKSNVLKNGFYEGLNKSTIKKMKKNGAISGCTTTIW